MNERLKTCMWAAITALIMTLIGNAFVVITLAIVIKVIK